MTPPAINSDVTVHAGVTRQIVEETIVLPASNVPSPSGPPPEILREARPASEGQSRDPAPKNAGLPPDVFQAVMKWIAAGSTPAPDQTAAAKITESAPSTLSAPTALTVPVSPAAPESVPATIPDRVIQIAEEHIHLEASPTPPAVANAEPHRRAAVPSESPVRVSIGTIQVRIESPATPAPAPVRPGRPLASARPAGPAVRASGFSQLRRHYLSPH